MTPCPGPIFLWCWGNCPGCLEQFPTQYSNCWSREGLPLKVVSFLSPGAIKWNPGEHLAWMWQKQSGGGGSLPKSLPSPIHYEYVNKHTSPGTHMGITSPTNGDTHTRVRSPHWLWGPGRSILGQASQHPQPAPPPAPSLFLCTHRRPGGKQGGTEWDFKEPVSYHSRLSFYRHQLPASAPPLQASSKTGWGR